LDSKEVAMTRRQFVGMAVLMAVALVGPATISTQAQKKDAGRVPGTVAMLNKDSQTLLVATEANESQKQVVYDDKTKFTKDNKPGSLDDVSNGRRVICLGTTNDKGQLMATHVDVRPAN
jgi:hypothetical protein